VYDPPDARLYAAELGSIVANGCRAFAFSGSQHPDGTLDKAEFARLGTAYSGIEQMQPYLEGARPVPGLAILFSEASRLWEPGVCSREGIPQGPHLDSVEGAMRAAVYSLWPSDILPDWRLDDNDLFRFQVLVMPNVTCLSQANADALRRYVAGGGCLIATLDTSLYDEEGQSRQDFALADLFGCHYRRRHDEYSANRYGSYLERRSSPLWQGTAETLLPASSPYLEVEPTTAAVLASHVLPAVALSDSQWVNWWSPPPNQLTSHPAVLLNHYGNGQVLYFSFELFGMLKQGFVWPLKAIANALALLAGAPALSVATVAPASVYASYMQQPEQQRLVVHLVNATVSMLKGEVLPVAGNRLVLDDVRLQSMGMRAKAARLVWPHSADLLLTAVAGRHEVALPALDVHQIVAVTVD
jgi:hypothetical protein